MLELIEKNKNHKISKQNQKGYIEKEIVKETDIVVQEAEETCDAPKPKDMIVLEVIKNKNTTNIFVQLFIQNTKAQLTFIFIFFLLFFFPIQ